MKGKKGHDETSRETNGKTKVLKQKFKQPATKKNKQTNEETCGEI